MNEDDILQSVTAKLTGDGLYVGQRVVVFGMTTRYATILSLSLSAQARRTWRGPQLQDRITVRKDGDDFDTYPLRSVCKPL
jgi:hypothetical protein